MDRKELEKRTKAFALKIIRLVTELPKGKIGDVLGYQLLKSGTFIGANYREANRAASRVDFIHRINIVEKEANETLYWLELLSESGIVDKQRLGPLMAECNELVAIFTASGKTSKAKRS